MLILIDCVHYGICLFSCSYMCCFDQGNTLKLRLNLSYVVRRLFLLLILLITQKMKWRIVPSPSSWMFSWTHYSHCFHSHQLLCGLLLNRSVNTKVHASSSAASSMIFCYDCIGKYNIKYSWICAYKKTWALNLK